LSAAPALAYRAEAGRTFGGGREVWSMTQSPPTSVERFEPCGVISITTDFGHKGPFIGTMKGMILMRFPAARIVDLTHETLVHWPAEAGFWIARSYRYFPHGSLHVGVVDPGVGTGRAILALEYDGHAFLAPDNGLLGALAARPGARAYRLDPGRLERHAIREPSATFHGRDIFAPVAGELASGRMRPHDLGPVVTDVVPSWLEDPDVTQGRVSGVVVTLDHFGNLITNVEGGLLARFRHAVVHAGGHALALKRTYGDVSPGEYLALVNSFGVLEIARAEQSAADGLGLGRGAPVTIVEAG
jgi:S-adenosyl-L-methionine hydrolase (adenosine-forming)